MTMDVEPLGTFDVVFFLGVLYHMENPLASLRRVASLSNGVAIIETHATVVPGYEHLELCEFYSSNQRRCLKLVGAEPESAEGDVPRRGVRPR
jgi:tRNA (mo5U34)-methyltransferase